MEGILQDMKALYSSRHLLQVDTFMEKWIAESCVVMGTALGETKRTREEVRDLFDSDLRYWYNLAIDDDRAAHEAFGDTALLTCPAEVSYPILENDKRYESYAAWCDEIARDTLASPAQKGAQIAFILDTLLASRKAKRRRNRLPLTIRVLMRDEKATFISFAFDKTIDTADHYLDDSADTTTLYAVEREGRTGDGIPGVAALLREKGYEDAVFETGDEGIFFGVALKRRQETLDEAMAAALADIKRENAYRTLFELRLRIAFLQKVYALESHPHAIVRFFGLAQDGTVPLFVPTYPLNHYIEWH